MNESTCNGNLSGIAEILKVIVVLQKNACPSTCSDSCDRPVLGGGANCIVCNTRPIVLYTCGSSGIPLSMPTTRTNAVCTDSTTEGCSNVFRVEKVDESTCTCRVLAPNPDTTSTYPYVTTDSVFTLNLSCLCAIRCLPDTYVDNVCC